MHSSQNSPRTEGTGQHETSRGDGLSVSIPQLLSSRQSHINHHDERAEWVKHHICQLQESRQGRLATPVTSNRSTRICSFGGFFPADVAAWELTRSILIRGCEISNMVCSQPCLLLPLSMLADRILQALSRFARRSSAGRGIHIDYRLPWPLPTPQGCLEGLIPLSNSQSRR